MINPYVGEVTCFGFDWAPEGWIKCEGQLISVDEFKQLFSVLGTTFDGDGLTTFGVPNFGTMTADGGQFCISAFGAARTEPRKALPGETTIFPFPPPPGWVVSHGQLVQVKQYRSLFDIVGNTYGGDGVTTFGLPQMIYVPPFNVQGNYGNSHYYISNAPIGSTDEGFQGEIKIFPSMDPQEPAWLPCDGRLLTINNPNLALFSLLGTTFGGNGKSNFALPNVTGLPSGLQGFVCQRGVFQKKPQ